MLFLMVQIRTSSVTPSPASRAASEPWDMYFEIVPLVAATAFTAYRFSLYWTHRSSRRFVPLVHVGDLAAKLQTPIRKRFCWSMCAARLLRPRRRPHSRRDPARAQQPVRGNQTTSPGTKTSTCTALDRRATSVRVARLLREQGSVSSSSSVRLRAWRKAGKSGRAGYPSPI